MAPLLEKTLDKIWINTLDNIWTGFFNSTESCASKGIARFTVSPLRVSGVTALRGLV